MSTSPFTVPSTGVMQGQHHQGFGKARFGRDQAYSTVENIKAQNLIAERAKAEAEAAANTPITMWREVDREEWKEESGGTTIKYTRVTRVWDNGPETVMTISTYVIGYNKTDLQIPVTETAVIISTPKAKLCDLDSTQLIIGTADLTVKPAFSPEKSDNELVDSSNTSSDDVFGAVDDKTEPQQFLGDNDVADDGTV